MVEVEEHSERSVLTTESKDELPPVSLAGAAARSRKRSISSKIPPVASDTTAELESQLDDTKRRLERALEDLSSNKRHAEAALLAEREKYITAEQELHHWRSEYEELAAKYAQESDALTRLNSTVSPKAITSVDYISQEEHDSAIETMSKLHMEELSHALGELSAARDKHRSLEEKLEKTEHALDALELIKNEEIASLQIDLQAALEASEQHQAHARESYATVEITRSRGQEAEAEIVRLKDVIKSLKDKSKVAAEASVSSSLEVKQMQERIDGLTAEMSKKENLIAILQEQLVKLAGDTWKEIVRDSADDGKGAKSIAKSTGAAKTLSSSTALSESAAGGGSGGGGERHVVTSLPPPASSRPTSATMRSARKSRPHSEGAPPSLSQREISSLLEATAGGADSASAWLTANDEAGNLFYYNKDTGETSWDPPQGFVGGGEASTASAEPVFVGDWMQMFDENGYQYWVNQVTGESAWEIPDSSQSIALSAPQASAAPAAAGGYTIEL